MVIVLPDYGGGEEHLAGAREEAEELGRRHAGAKFLRGSAATAGSLAAALSSKGALVHFSGHGLADLEPGTAPELLLGGGDSLGVARATARLVRAGLVVLASCSGGQAARFRDGGRLVAEVALTDALLAAGAGGVVAASWQTKDRLSAALMEVFHAQQGNLGPAAALGRAQLNLKIALNPPHPRFWAPYAMYGGWKRP